MKISKIIKDLLGMYGHEYSSYIILLNGYVSKQRNEATYGRGWKANMVRRNTSSCIPGTALGVGVCISFEEFESACTIGQ